MRPKYVRQRGAHAVYLVVLENSPSNPESDEPFLPTGSVLPPRRSTIWAIPLPKGVLAGKVEVVERLGDRTHLHVRLADNAMLVAEDAGMSRAAPGDAVNLRLDGAQAHLFDAQGRGYRAVAEARA